MRPKAYEGTSRVQQTPIENEIDKKRRKPQVFNLKLFNFAQSIKEARNKSLPLFISFSVMPKGESPIKLVADALLGLLVEKVDSGCVDSNGEFVAGLRS